MNESICLNNAGSFFCLKNKIEDKESNSTRSSNVTFPIIFTVTGNLNSELENSFSSEFNEASSILSKELQDTIEEALGKIYDLEE